MTPTTTPTVPPVDGPADPEARVGSHFHGGLRAHQLGCRLVHLPVDDQTERALLRVVAQQHDRLREVRIGHLRHGKEKNRGGAGHGSMIEH